VVTGSNHGHVIAHLPIFSRISATFKGHSLPFITTLPSHYGDYKFFCRLGVVNWPLD
jgi:hypothetical protein